MIPLTVTVYTEALMGLTCTGEVPMLPVVTSEKSVASTPVTESLKVAVKLTLLATVVSPTGDARLMDTTDG